MLLHNSTALRDLDRSFNILNTRIELLLAAYPKLRNRSQIALILLKDELKLAGQLEQLINIFETQGWESFNKEPSPGIFTVKLAPDTNPQAALNQLEFVLGQTGQSTLRAFCPNHPMSITLWGHAPTILSRLGVFPSYVNSQDWPLTKPKLISNSTGVAANIVKILGAPRTTLDLLMS